MKNVISFLFLFFKYLLVSRWNSKVLMQKLCFSFSRRKTETFGNGRFSAFCGEALSWKRSFSQKNLWTIVVMMQIHREKAQFTSDKSLNEIKMWQIWRLSDSFLVAAASGGRWSEAAPSNGGHGVLSERSLTTEDLLLLRVDSVKTWEQNIHSFSACSLRLLALAFASSTPWCNRRPDSGGQTVPLTDFVRLCKRWQRRGVT